MIGFPTILINTLSLLMICLVILMAWRRRSDTITLQFIIVSVFMFLWALGSFFEVLTPTLEGKILWRNITQIGVFGTPATSLVFALIYTGFFEKYLKPLSVFFYSTQLIGVLLVWTDGVHHLIRSNFYILRGDMYETLVVESTALAHILISINFAYTIGAFLLLLTSIFLPGAKRVHKNALFLVIGMGVSILYSFIKVVSNEKFGIMVPMSGIFAIADLCMLFGILKYDLLTLAPIARNEVFNVVGDGVVIAAPNGSIVDLNREAIKIFNIESEGKQRRELLKTFENAVESHFPKWREVFACEKTTQFKFEIEAEVLRHYLCDVYPVYNKHKNLGSIFVLRDITEQKKNTDLLKFRAERDGLTGVYNRMTFIESVEDAMGEDPNNLCLLFLDVDYFKKINDNHGHAFGDHVLIHICEVMRSQLHGDAVLGRMGGEEFAIFMRTSGIEPAKEIAETLRTAIADHIFISGDHSAQVTISIGGAFGRFFSFDELYQIADTNVYRAKEAGRNYVQF